MKKIRYTISSALFFFALFGWAGSSKAADFYAADCTSDSVNAAITAANGGADEDNTVHLPACDVVWTPLTEYAYVAGNSKKLRILGAGKGITRIRYFMFHGLRPTNLVEWGQMTAYAGESDEWNSAKVFSDTVEPYAYGTELYWHDLEILNYPYNAIANLTGWYGVITRSTFTTIPCTSFPGCQDHYGFYVNGWSAYDKTTTLAKRGTRDALFFEDNEFHNFGHNVSGFCNAYYVQRYNKIYARMGGMNDLHSAGYSGCTYANGWDAAHGDGGGGTEFYENEIHQEASWNDNYGLGNAYIGVRSGSSNLIFNNKKWSHGFTAPPGFAEDYVDQQCNTGSQSQKCGTGAGETCARKYAWQSSGITDGCFQLHDEIRAWNNTSEDSPTILNLYRVADHTTASDCEDCIRWGIEMFESAPEGYVPFTYPHPLTLGADTTPPARPTGLNVI